LYGAIALSKSSHRAAAVPENLHLNVSGLRDESFQIHAATSKVRLAQAPDSVKRLVQFLARTAQADADPAASSGALQHHRVTDALSRSDRRWYVFEGFARWQER